MNVYVLVFLTQCHLPPLSNSLVVIRSFIADIERLIRDWGLDRDEDGAKVGEQPCPTLQQFINF